MPGESQPNVDTEMVACVRSLVGDQHESARQSRHLARQEARVYGGMYPVLLGRIARDAEKHAFILKFVPGDLEDAARTPTAPAETST